MKAIILAGGVGERFWPLSTDSLPKQFLKLFGKKSLIRETFERLAYRLKPKDIYVVTNARYINKTKEELPEIPSGNILGEPEKKNTAPACVLGTLCVEDDNEIIFIVPADHYIPDVETFWEKVDRASVFLEKNEGIVTFGIFPTRPETGYGYIEVESKYVKNEKSNVVPVRKFKEKPDFETAKKYLEKGNYFWNSGMFMWKKKYFIDQMKKHSPEVIEPFEGNKNIEEIYKRVPSISIDYALMEKADRIYTIPSNFVWSDVGNWLSLKELKVKSSDSVVALDCENVFVKSTKPVVVIGMKNIVVVESEHGILVSTDEGVQKIREAVKKMKEI
ncbi:mannose-1-phosphate guanylyltransferase [Thermosipho ferrireducens]|uniref:Mannose-1-phosphate guanylyltransferase n=1 Tax=Thermosipho ferrireducens TaxID=2571116 RepID=A0ABX7SAJ6_9BACT|nr:mannose-1-phosphate guanylyltransferase [Thermosipho ferrireducens]QTA38448.1 mannose-1-phosphate guanylyltransferase [Thermosipho ferrireducens]